MRKFITYFLTTSLVALVVIQFIRPDKNAGGYETVMLFENETKPSEDVALLLKENCYDCHSDQTRYPWYAEIAPVSYWLADHIKHGKGHFNVSAWDSYSLKKKDHKLEELIEMIEKEEMPLDSYTWLHGNLEENDIKLILQWAAIARIQFKDRLEISSN